MLAPEGDTRTATTLGSAGERLLLSLSVQGCIGEWGNLRPHPGVEIQQRSLQECH